MQPELGSIMNGTIEHITNFGAFVRLENGKKGLVHISEISNQYVKEISDLYQVGDTVKVKIIKIDEQQKIGLSIKQAQTEPAKKQAPSVPKKPEDAFEEMLAKFKKVSEERMLDIKRNQENKRGSYSRRR